MESKTSEFEISRDQRTWLENFIDKRIEKYFIDKTENDFKEVIEKLKAM